MPDGMNFDAPKQNYSYCVLARQADVALAEGDEGRCVELIERLYALLDEKLRA